MGRSNGRWKFASREVRAVAALLPLVGVLVWVTTVAVRSRFDDSARLLGDGLADAVPVQEASGDVVCDSLFRFDPNEVTYEEMRRLGLSKRTAAGIVKYREAGKVFAVPEEFAACYGVTDSAFAVLRPYIVIGSRYRVGKRASVGRVAAESRAAADTSRFDPNMLDKAGFIALGFTARQAETIVNYRRALGGFRTPEDFARSYAVSDEMFDTLRDRIVISGGGEEECGEAESSRGRVVFPVDINSADSALLDAVPGIGPRTAAGIIAYRSRLGGFHDPEQVMELGYVTESNMEAMRTQIWADSCLIRKIDINFAAPGVLAAHPYIAPKTLRKLLHNRQLKGGWTAVEEMIEDGTLTAAEAVRLAPYLYFGTAEGDAEISRQAE